MSQKRKLTMHPHLLMDVIKRQAGTLGKAVYEGVMNSVDAKAKVCNIIIDEEGMLIVDDGRGFQNSDEIDNFFATFGTPHTAEEQKTFGTFRMGRGQLFSFGKNTWRSGKFKMEVDVQNDGDDWHFYTMKDNKKGCCIEVKFYRRLSSIEVDDVIREVKKLVKWISFSPIVVSINNAVVSNNPRKEEVGFWTYETDQLWMKVRKSSGGHLALYHLGGYIQEFHDYKFGVSGEVISKIPMLVNFARNSVMDECPVWKEAKKFVNECAGKEIAKKTSLDDAGRQRLADQFRQAELSPAQLKSSRLFTDVLGRHHSLEQLKNASNRYKLYSVAADGDRLGDKIIQHKIAFVFGTSTLDRFEFTDPELFMKFLADSDPDTIRFRKHNPTYKPFKWRYSPFETVSEQFDQHYQFVDEKEWTPSEAAVVSAVSRLDCWFVSQSCTGRDQCSSRRIVIGIGNADGWTDGRTYIALNRDWLKTTDIGTVQGAGEIGALLLHEYCHDDDDRRTHIHSLEFYQNYHDRHRDLSGFVHEVVGNLRVEMERLELKLTRKQLKQQDLIRALAEKSISLDAVAARSK